MINKLQALNGKTKLKFHQSTSIYYDEKKYRRQNITFQFEEVFFAKNAQGISKISHEVSLLIKILETKPLPKSSNLFFYELYYTFIK